MRAELDTDQWGASSHHNMISHLTGPFGAGATRVPMVVAVDEGQCRVSAELPVREPLVLAAPVAPLGPTGLLLRARLRNSDDTLTPLPDLEFAAYTEVGASLALFRPAVAAATQIAQPFTLLLDLFEVAADGGLTAVPAEDVGARITLELLGGVLGRVLYLLGAEKQRMRRSAREIAAMRVLATARDDALDRFGAALGVPRFGENLLFADGAVVTENRREPDEEYRRRLGIYQPFLQPNRRHLLDLLNGPDGDGGLAQGLDLGVQFRLLETPNPFAVALHLVNAGDVALRDNFLEWTRRVHLIWPLDDPDSNAVHAARFLPAARQDREQALRARLRDFYAFPAGAALAPALAVALDRLRRCREALAENTPWQLLRAQDSAGGSRYELGLGVDLAAPDSAELDRLGERLADPGRAPTDDPEIEALLVSMAPRPAADDPEGRWLLEACGLRTVHRVDAATVYLSHFPTFGMAITAAATAAPGAPLPLEVRYHAPGDPGTNVVLAGALQEAAVEWAAGGGEEWLALPEADARARWSQAEARPPDDPGLVILRAAGLPAIETPAPVVERLGRLPGELVETIVLGAGEAQRVLNGDVTVVDELRALLRLFRDKGLAAVLPLITGPAEVVMVASVIGLPEAGINLSDRRATGFRWYVVPIQGAGGSVKAIGSRTTFVADGPGLSALVAIGYARRGLVDPYEFRVELPEDALLSLLQYELLMNALDHAHPLGVEINTYSVRQQHVDLDGDGQADPLQPAISRTYRQFRRRHHRGEAGLPEPVVH